MRKFDQEGNRPLLVVLTIAFALSHLDRQILAITLHDIGVEFQLTDLELGALSGLAFALIYVLLGFPVALMVRPGNRKIIVGSALALWSIMTGLTGAATSFAMLFLARVGVGIGEAGCVPPSHSMITDAFPYERRSSALAFFSAGANVGVFLAFLIGGLLAHKFGWRSAFLVAAIPGIVWAVVLFMVKEPVPSSELKFERRASLRIVAKALFADASLRHALIGGSLSAMIGYGAVAWISVHIIRTHGLSTAQVGLYLAVVIGVFGAVGTWAGGYVSDKLAQFDPRWRLKAVAISIIVLKPLSVAFYLIDNTAMALALFVLPAAGGGIFIGPTLSHVYSRIQPVDRPVMTAVFMFFINLIGLGLGPTLVGLMSDGLAQEFSENSLRIALAILQVAGIWGAIHFWISANKGITAPSITRE